MPALPPRPKRGAMPRASVLAAAQHQATTKDDEDGGESEEDEEERRDDVMGSMKGGMMGSFMGKTMGETGELFRSQGGTLRRRQSGSDAIGSTVAHLPASSNTPSFESRRAHAPRGNKDSVETSFTQLLAESGGDEGSSEAGEDGQNAVGRYLKARAKMRRAEEALERGFAARDESVLEDRAAERHQDEMVRISYSTGAPTLKNPATRQMELTRRRLEQQRGGPSNNAHVNDAYDDDAANADDVSSSNVTEESGSVGPGAHSSSGGGGGLQPTDNPTTTPAPAPATAALLPVPAVDPPVSEVQKAVFRSYTAGELVCVGEKAGPGLPAECANTLSMQLGLQRVYLPRNDLEGFEAPESDQGRHFHARHMMHVTEIDMQHNHRFSQLWDDVGSLMCLQRLCLQHTAMCEFPPSFLWLTSLKHIDVTHCSFKLLPERFGDLASLEYLNIKDNLLVELPPTFHQLKCLKHLDVSGNGMAFLAIKPLAEATDDSLDHAWEELPDPSSTNGEKKTYWYNKITGQSRKAIPESLKIKALGAAAEGSKAAMVEGTKAYSDKRAALSAKGVPEYECCVDTSAGTIYYANHVNGTTRWDMPPVMDSFGVCGGLEVLKLNNNLLRDLPESVSLLTRLRLLEAKDNYLKELPSQMGCLKELRVLRLTNNELKTLPTSMNQLQGLTELVLTGNHLTGFPAWAGDLVGLRQLMLGNNQIVALPYKIGYCTALTDLQLYNNPLEDPPYESTLGGMDQLLWTLREKYLGQNQGPTPEVTPHVYGIGDEKNEIKPLFQRRLQKILKAAAQSQELDLLQNGLHRMPQLVTDGGLPSLTHLNMTSQHFKGEGASPVFPNNCMSQLHTLWIKRCELDGVDDSTGYLRSLTELDLSENAIEGFSPKVFRHLKKLKVINVQRNHLYDVPEEIGLIAGLKDLYLDMNRLDNLPENLTKLKQLSVLSASMNQLQSIPSAIGRLQHLMILNVSGNNLHRLPSGMGYLNLTELKASHNRIEVLSDDFLAPNLQKSIELLHLQNNNLLELPPVFDECSKLKQLLIDYNPMRSPPPELSEEDLETVLQYCRIRTERVREMTKLLEQYGFEIDVAHFTPRAVNALTGNFGLLTPSDRQEFDRKLDSYVNGMFFDCEFTASVVVDAIDNLRHERQYVFYNMLMQELLGVLRDESLKDAAGVGGPLKRFSHNVLRVDLRRPWGRQGEAVTCYAVTLEALLKDCQPNRHVRQFRPSLFNLAVRRMPVTLFEYLPEMLKDAVADFEGPYGLVGKIEKDVKFEMDEYVSELSGRERNKAPPLLPALVVARVLYTASEARRRQEEDEAYWEAFLEVRAESR